MTAPTTSPTPDTAFIEALERVVGANQVLTREDDMVGYQREQRGALSGRARAVVRPGNTAEVAGVLALCAEHNVPIVPQGGNTGLVGASTPDDSGTEVVLSLSRLNRVRAIEPLDNTLTLEAGCTVLQAQEAAASVGRLFGLSLASEGSATIGGVVSTNAGGEQVLRYGNTREQTLGIEVVLADGRVLDVLTPLRKDNTGYDLKQLFIGGEGTLGIITAATFKLYSRPRQVVTAWVTVRDPQAAVSLLSLLTDTVGERVTAFELISQEALSQVLALPASGLRAPIAPAAWQVLFDVSETSAHLDVMPAVEQALSAAIENGLVDDAALASSEQQAHDLWAVRERIPEAQKHQGPSIKHDISVCISRIPAFIEQADAALQALMPGVRLCCFGHVGDGNLHYNQTVPVGMAPADFRAREDAIHDVVYRVVSELGGSISAEHGIGRLKQDAFLRHKSPVALDLMSRIKRSIDPATRFNPGRMLPRQPHSSLD